MHCSVPSTNFLGQNLFGNKLEKLDNGRDASAEKIVLSDKLNLLVAAIRLVALVGPCVGGGRSMKSDSERVFEYYMRCVHLTLKFDINALISHFCFYRISKNGIIFMRQIVWVGCDK